MISRRTMLKSLATLPPAAAVLLSARHGIAATGSGAIAEENRKPGTQDWLLKNLQPVEVKQNDDHFGRRPAVEAFCSHASIRAGQTLTVYVSTDPASKYKADVYRLGYYGGAGGRRVLSLDPREGVPQPTPSDGDK